MIDYLFSAAVLVQFALLFYALGFLARDELWLRILVLMGTIFYLLYYYFIEDEPLWDAIFASGVLGVINVIMICLLMTERTTFAMSEEMRHIYQNFSTLTPGQFRKIMRFATYIDNAGQPLCEIDKVNDHLHLLIAGTADMHKAGKRHTISAPMFLGEVGFLKNEGASATVVASKDAKTVSWAVSDLRNLMRRSAPMNNALIALFSTDMAHKLGKSQPIDG